MTKLMSLSEAVRRFVHAGDILHVGYADGRPNAAINEIIRQWHGRDPGFTVVTAGLASSQHALVESGVVTKVIASFAGENYPTARPNKAFQRAVASGRVEIEAWSLWSLNARLVAGALGVPWLPIRSLAGSDLARDLRGRGYLEITDGAETSGAVSALHPDVVLVQAVAADRDGNVVHSGPYGEGMWGAMAAARGVIVCAERIVETDEIRTHSALSRIPAHAVRAVCQVPFGSHPYGMHNPGFPGVEDYVEDEGFIDDVRRASGDPETFRAWIEEWITGTADHGAYLAKLGRRHLEALSARNQPSPALPLYGGPEISSSERMVAVASRTIADRVRDSGVQAVLAGVGQANLAAWLAIEDLKRQSRTVELMSEIGMYGYRPQPGDPFIFSKRTVGTCALTTDTMSVLGAFVGGPATRSMGVIGAGQIDQWGNVNSSRSPDGGYLVGSGGANDVGVADDIVVVVDHHPRRLVERVPYITVPGTNIGAIVTSEGVLERDAQGFALTAVIGEEAPTADDIARIQAGCGWDLRIAPTLRRVPPPTTAELETLRGFDPQRRFLGAYPRVETEALA